MGKDDINIQIPGWHFKATALQYGSKLEVPSYLRPSSCPSLSPPAITHNASLSMHSKPLSLLGFPDLWMRSIMPFYGVERSPQVLDKGSQKITLPSSIKQNPCTTITRQMGNMKSIHQPLLLPLLFLVPKGPPASLLLPFPLVMSTPNENPSSWTNMLLSVA